MRHRQDKNHLTPVQVIVSPADDRIGYRFRSIVNGLLYNGLVCLPQVPHISRITITSGFFWKLIDCILVFLRGPSQTSYPTSPLRGRFNGYLLPIEDGIIGNIGTCALVDMDDSIDLVCWRAYNLKANFCSYTNCVLVSYSSRPDFNSSSLFCPLLDINKRGYFSISPPVNIIYTTKQSYLPSSSILQARYIHEDGVANLVDFFPRPRTSFVAGLSLKGRHGVFREAHMVQEELKKWLVRRVECTRRNVTLDVEVSPAFGYAREGHVTTLLQETHEAGIPFKAVTFHSVREGRLKLQLGMIIDRGEESEFHR